MHNNIHVTLVSTLHDPAGSMTPFLPQALPLLLDLYIRLVIVATPQTAGSLLETLRHERIHLSLDGTTHIGDNRRDALTLGLQLDPVPFLQYCDFDRLLHWALHHPTELRHVVHREIPAAHYLALGRTPAAFASHPPVQQALESLTNRVFSHIFGQEMDVTAGSCGLSRPVAQEILRHSTERSNATDTEWPMIVDRLAPAGLSVRYLAVQGLEFETATFFGPQVFTQVHNADNWARRAQLAHESIAAVLRIDRLVPAGSCR